jgi:hypothetical protein
LQDGPKFFVELMDAVGSRDGRDVVRHLEAVRLAQGIDRDSQGRYVLCAPAAGGPSARQD